MKWLQRQPSLAAVTALNLAWLAIALASSETQPWAERVWGGEEASPVEHLELALIVGYIGLWLWIAWRVRARSRAPRALAYLMVLQLVLMMSEEMDWCSALGFHHRNLRQASRGIIPDVMDTPSMSAYLLAFVFSPLVPLRSVRSFLDRVAPVCAERADALAVIAGQLCSVLVWVSVGDQALGELQQMVVYLVLGVITVRIVRATRAA